MTVPFVRTTLKSAPATVRTPAPLFSTASGIVASRPVMLTVTPSVVPKPRPPLSVSTSVSKPSPVKAETSIVFAPAPPVSSANSNPAMVSITPLVASVVLVSVKFTSPASTSVSSPIPPSIESTPPLPVMRSSPEPPIRVSAPLAPISTSSPAPPRSSTAPTKADASSRSAPSVPSIATFWMFDSALSRVVPWVVVSALTLPPTRLIEVAVIGVWSRPACLPTKVTIHGPPSTGWLTKTSPWSTALSRTRALCTSRALAFQASASLVWPAKLRLNVPLVTVALSEIVTTSLAPSAKSSVALVALPTSSARAPTSMAVLKPAPPSSMSRPTSPIRMSSPAPPFKTSSPAPPSRVTAPSVKAEASSVLLLTPPVSLARSTLAIDATSPDP